MHHGLLAIHLIIIIKGNRDAMVGLSNPPWTTGNPSNNNNQWWAWQTHDRLAIHPYNDPRSSSMVAMHHGLLAIHLIIIIKDHHQWWAWSTHDGLVIHPYNINKRAGIPCVPAAIIMTSGAVCNSGLGGGCRGLTLPLQRRDSNKNQK